MRERIENILKKLSEGAYERAEVIALSLLGALSGESVFMLGLPGVGKSMIARRLKMAFSDARVFEYLMSRFSTPDEIFGPVSISKLKNEDCYERIASGYLPDAEVIFLDEIWKAGPAIQNSLLTVLNEKVYLNGNREMRLPVEAIVSASNELPAEGEGLEALWDRFLIRYIVEPIRHKDNFFKLLDGKPGKKSGGEITPISDSEYSDIQDKSQQVVLPLRIKELLFGLRQRMASEAKKVSEDTEENGNFYVSDRRWRKAVGVMKTSAYLNGRNEVSLSDTLLLEHMLWNSDAEIDKIRYLIAETVVTTMFADLLATYRSISEASTKKGAKKDEPYTKDNIHYEIICDDYILKIKIADYENMRRRPGGYFFASETADGVLVFRDKGLYTIRFSKPGYVCINNYNYQLAMADGSHLTTHFLNTVGEDISRLEAEFKRDISNNIFVRESGLIPVLRNSVKTYRKRFSPSES